MICMLSFLLHIESPQMYKKNVFQSHYIESLIIAFFRNKCILVTKFPFIIVLVTRLSTGALPKVYLYNNFILKNIINLKIWQLSYYKKIMNLMLHQKLSKK